MTVGGMTFIHYSKVGGVLSSEVRNVYGVHAVVGRGHGVCPLVGGCPLVGVSIIRGSTVIACRNGCRNGSLYMSIIACRNCSLYNSMQEWLVKYVYNRALTRKYMEGPWALGLLYVICRV